MVASERVKLLEAARFLIRLLLYFFCDGSFLNKLRFFCIGRRDKLAHLVTYLEEKRLWAQVPNSKARFIYSSEGGEQIGDDTLGLKL